jgi:hypothetical protein
MRNRRMLVLAREALTQGYLEINKNGEACQTCIQREDLVILSPHVLSK